MAAVGKKFTDFTCSNVKTDKKVKLKDYIKGQNAVVVFVHSDATAEPVASRLEDDAFAHDNIKFVLVSIDSMEAAKELSQGQSLNKAIHLFAPANIKGVKAYGVVRPPHFVSIGKDGKILLSDENATEYVNVFNTE